VAISPQVSPASLLDVTAHICQTALAEETGMNINQIGAHNGSEMVDV
jgi:hypothetical protein